MSRTETVVHDLEQTLSNKNLDPKIRVQLERKLKNVEENQIINK